MKPVLTLIAFGLIAFTIYPSVVLAHQLDRADSLGVTVHIDPDDSPIAGEVTVISVTIRDSRDGKSFPTGECDCWLFIKSAGEHSFDVGRAFTLNNAFNPVEYTFEEAGAYDLQVSAAPHEYIEKPSFEPFTADFEVEVLDTQSVTPRLIVSIGLLVGILAALAWVGVQIRRSLKAK